MTDDSWLCSLSTLLNLACDKLSLDPGWMQISLWEPSTHSRIRLMASCSFTHNEQLGLVPNEVGVEEWSLKSVQFLERSSSAGVKRKGWLRGSPVSSPGVKERGGERAAGRATVADRCSRRGVWPRARLKKTGSTLGRAHHPNMSHHVTSYGQPYFAVTLKHSTINFKRVMLLECHTHRKLHSVMRRVVHLDLSLKFLLTHLMDLKNVTCFFSGVWMFAQSVGVAWLWLFTCTLQTYV